MARKALVLLKDAPVKLNKRAREYLAGVERTVPEEGCEEQWQSYVNSVRAVENVSARLAELEKVVGKKGSASRHWPVFQAELRKYDKVGFASFGALNVYQFTVKHRFDKIGIPEDELRAVVIDSLSDKMDELAFSVNYGILGSKVAQAIRQFTVEESSGDPVFCVDCQD